MIPKCDFRGEFLDGKWVCSCIQVKNERVSPKFCAACPLARHNNESTVGKFTEEDSAKPPCKSCKPPRIIDLSKNFASAAAAHAADLFRNVDHETYQNRLNICESNECGAYDNGRCMDCGCFLDIKAKWRSSTCPQNRWPPTDNGV